MIQSIKFTHKALKNLFSKFSKLLESINQPDDKELQLLRLNGEELFILLVNQISIQDKYMLAPLSNRLKGSAYFEFEEHETILKMISSTDHSLSKLEKGRKDLIDDFRREFYILSSRCHYHFMYEEQITEKLLEDNFTESELLSQFLKSVRKTEPFILMLWLKHVVPHVLHSESVRLLTWVGSIFSEQDFAKLCDILSDEMSVEDYMCLSLELKKYLELDSTIL